MERRFPDAIDDTRLAADVVITLLGGFRIEAGAHIISESGWRLRKARNLVKLLSLAPDRRLHREQILDALWPDLDADAAGNNLRTTLHVARRMIAGDAAESTVGIDTRGDFLVLFPGQDVWIDVVAFEDAIKQARGSCRVEYFTSAAALYVGDLLPEDRYESWAASHRDRIRERWLVMLHELAGLYEAREEWIDAIATYQRIVEAEPADEAAHTGLMRSQHFIGQRVAALRQYHVLRDQLQTELDVDPAASSTQLYEAILTGNEEMVSRFRVQSKAVVDDHLPATGDSVDLPEHLTRFVGRTGEISAVTALLDQSRLVTLHGLGGIGKTRLSIEVASGLATSFPGGVWFIDLAPLDDAALIDGVVAARIGVDAGQSDSQRASIIKRLRGKPSLLVFDNCEHLIEATANLSNALLHGAPDVTILATSREPLRVRGEVLYPVPPLHLEPPEGAPAGDEPKVSDAVQLFVERARLADPTFSATDADMQVIHQLCRSLDGMPLAIELAAARARLLPVEHMLRRMDQVLGLLSDGNRASSERQQSLRNSVEWSFDLLSDTERRLFSRLGIFSGGFTVEAVEAICADADLDDAGMQDLVLRLAERSLIAPGRGDSQARFRMIEPLRQYANQRIGDVERAALRERHARYFTTLVVDAEPHMMQPDALAWLSRVERDYDNVRTALSWVIETGDAYHAARLGYGLWRYWWQQGLIHEGRQLLARLLEIPGIETEMPYYADAQFGAAMLAKTQRDQASAEAALAASLAAAIEANDRVRIASAQTQLGHSALMRGDLETAETLLHQGLAVRLELGRTREIAISYGLFGELNLARRDLNGAQAHFEAGLKLHDHIDDVAHYAWLLAQLGQLAAARSDLEAARNYTEQSLAHSASVPSRTPILLLKLARVAFDEGDITEAIRLTLQGLNLSLSMEMPSSMTMALSIFAAVSSASGQPYEALRLAAAADALRAASHVVLSPDDEFWIGRRLRQATLALSRAERERATAEGQAYTLERAVADVSKHVLGIQPTQS